MKVLFTFGGMPYYLNDWPPTPHSTVCNIWFPF